MDSLKSRSILFLVSFVLVMGGIVGAGLYYLLPDYYPVAYPGILLFYFVVELTVIYVVDYASRKYESRKLLNAYMIVRISKLFLALIFVGISALIIKDNVKSFVIVFVLFYFLFIIFDVYFFSKIEKRLKEKKSL